MTSLAPRVTKRESRPELECARCGYRWQPRCDSPAACPRCFRRDWREPIIEEPKKEEMVCGLCGHTWIPRIETQPKACPACKRFDWAKKISSRQKPTKAERQRKSGGYVRSYTPSKYSHMNSLSASKHEAADRLKEAGDFEEATCIRVLLPEEWAAVREQYEPQEEEPNEQQK